MAGPPLATSPDADRPARRLVGPDGRPLTDDDGFLVPPYRTFAAVWNALNRVYRYTYDEAMRDSPQKALQMRRDCSIEELLQERYLAVTSLPWHLEPENPKNAKQQDVADDLTAVIKATPRLQSQSYYLMEAAWYGRYGSQQVIGEREVNGRPRQCVVRHSPVNGDKIQYDFDGNPLVYVNSIWATDFRKNQPDRAERLLTDRLVYGDRAPMLRLTDRSLRERFVIHQHMAVDADFFEGEKAGGLHGVGLRDKIYWSWWMKQEILAWMLSYLEKVGANGILLFYFPDGNEKAKLLAEAAAASSSTKTAFAVPVPAGSNRQQSGAEVLPASTQGTEQLHHVIGEYFESHHERLIVGQSMSSGKDKGDGLGGTGRADFARDTKWQITKFDADNLAETRTEDTVRVLQRLNHPDAKFPVRFVCDVPDPDAESKLNSAKVLVDMGVPVKEDEVRAAARLSKPQDGDVVIEPDQSADADDGTSRARETE